MRKSKILIIRKNYKEIRRELERMIEFPLKSIPRQGISLSFDSTRIRQLFGKPQHRRRATYKFFLILLA